MDQKARETPKQIERESDREMSRVPSLEAESFSTQCALHGSEKGGRQRKIERRERTVLTHVPGERPLSSCSSSPLPLPSSPPFREGLTGFQSRGRKQWGVYATPFSRSRDAYRPSALGPQQSSDGQGAGAGSLTPSSPHARIVLLSTCQRGGQREGREAHRCTRTHTHTEGSDIETSSLSSLAFSSCNLCHIKFTCSSSS